MRQVALRDVVDAAQELRDRPADEPARECTDHHGRDQHDQHDERRGAAEVIAGRRECVRGTADFEHAQHARLVGAGLAGRAQRQAVEVDVAFDSRTRIRATAAQAGNLEQRVELPQLCRRRVGTRGLGRARSHEHRRLPAADPPLQIAKLRVARRAKHRAVCFEADAQRARDRTCLALESRAPLEGTAAQIEVRVGRARDHDDDRRRHGDASRDLHACSVALRREEMFRGLGAVAAASDAAR